ncbi:ankyrin repeat domain-containing protein [uncultured Litoreibacter sp.]|uniref:ankyrin repeat domain-containing protein n=1 Tax=uncultured Litoreibacter sp. TaxID=1392394 RepID=UPI002604AF61|nr:ankyrin repeat domain-containing protein [uncultured Litoreibacter sp.]
MMLSRMVPVALFTAFSLSVAGAYMVEGRKSLSHPAAMSDAQMRALDLYYTEMKLALQVGDSQRFEELVSVQIEALQTGDIGDIQLDTLPAPYDELRDLLLTGSVTSARNFLLAHRDLDLNAPQGRNGAVPLIWATAHVDAVPSMVKLLLSQGANPRFRTARGYSVLHAAASPFNYYPKADDMERLLEMLPPELVTSPNRIGLTPLHLALINAQSSLAVGLLARGADPDTPPPSDVSLDNMPGLPPLMMAGGNVDLVQALLASGADPRATDLAGRRVIDVVTEGALAAERNLQDRLSASAAEESDRAYAADYARARDMIRAALDGRLAAEG